MFYSYFYICMLFCPLLSFTSFFTLYTMSFDTLVPFGQEYYCGRPIYTYNFVQFARFGFLLFTLLFIHIHRVTCFILILCQ